VSYSYSYGKPYVYGQMAEEEPIRQEPEREPTGVAGHGLSAYRHRGCRCEVCTNAKARSNRSYRDIGKTSSTQQ
jgi:hypothetical protein